MTEKQERKDVSPESSPEVPTKAGSENAVADDGTQKSWSQASAVSHQNDQTLSKLDMKSANAPLELVDHTDTGSQKLLVSSALQGSDAGRATGVKDKVPSLGAVSRDDLARLSKNDLMAAGLLRDLDSAAHIANPTERAERETQILKLATQTYGKKAEAKESPEPKQRLRTVLKSSFTEVADSAPPLSGDGGKENVPHKLESGAFALGIEYDAPPQNSDDQLAEKLGRFAEALYKNAVKDITDPKKQAEYWQAQEEKFIGIGMGLNDAKESMKHAAVGAFNAIADGSAEKFLLNPKTYEQLTKAVEIALQKMAENPNATTEAFAAAMNALGAKTAQFSESYSKVTPQEQGRMIGNVMFAFINPEGSLEAPELLAKAGARSEAAVAESFAAVMKSGTAEEIVQNLKLIRDLAKSPEMHQWVLDSIVPHNNGLELAMATAGAPAKALETEMGNFNAMAGWDDFVDRLKSGLRGGKPSAAEVEVAAAEKVSNILKLEGDKFVTAAIEHMVEKPLQTSGEAFEHWQEMREALKTIPEIDLRISLAAGYKFYFPKFLADIDPVLAKTQTLGELPILNENLPGLTDIDTQRTFVPIVRIIESSNKTQNISTMMDLPGILRHEVGQQLCEILKWKDKMELRLVFNDERNALSNALSSLSEVEVGVSQPLGESWNYAFEQVTTDLYALTHGGIGTGKDAEKLLTSHFPKTYDLLKRNNWYRQAGTK